MAVVKRLKPVDVNHLDCNYHWGSVTVLQLCDEAIF